MLECVSAESRVFSTLGFPSAAIASMQEARTNLRDTCWNIRKLNHGLSMRFFWPCSSSAVASSHSYSTVPSKY